MFFFFGLNILPYDTSDSDTKLDGNMECITNSASPSSMHEENHPQSTSNQGTTTTATMDLNETKAGHERATGGPAKSLPTIRASSPGRDLSSASTLDVEDVGTGDSVYHGGPYSGGWLFYICLLPFKFRVDRSSSLTSYFTVANLVFSIRYCS